MKEKKKKTVLERLQQYKSDPFRVSMKQIIASQKDLTLIEGVREDNNTFEITYFGQEAIDALKDELRKYDKTYYRDLLC